MLKKKSAERMTGSRGCQSDSRIPTIKRAIHWFRRDLRISDNTALFHAHKQAGEILPVYILSTWKKKHPWTGAHRQEFLSGCLTSLSGNLKALGGSLIIRAGEPVAELLKLARESGSEAIFFNRGSDPHSVKVQDLLATEAGKMGITTYGFKDITIFEPGEILTKSKEPFRVFTPYARAWHALEKPKPFPAIRDISVPAGIFSLPLPSLGYWHLQSEGEIIEAGETMALKRFNRFLNRSATAYGHNRNLPSEDATSRLSQDLRFGTISPRHIYFHCVEAARECSTAERRSINLYVNELIWREFYVQILANFPGVLNHDFSDKFRGLEWEENESAFSRWREGTTGFPIVDAGMRQLNETGYMHNRVRMIVAMFLTKDLHIHWKNGEQYFLQKLVDGEVASNNGGWQWSAGTGADAAPYFRVQNPWTQTQNYDPEGEYIKRWVRELKDVSPEKFMVPSSTGIARDYPAPMVNHAEQREKTLGRFSRARHL